MHTHISARWKWIANSDDSGTIDGALHCTGVELAANFDSTASTSSSDECSDFYRGPHANSEPEAKLLSNFLLESEHNIEMLLTLDGYGNRIHYSLSNDIDDDAREIARFAARTSNYTIATRGSADESSMAKFARERTKIKYILEIQAQDDMINGFFVPSTSIEARADEIFRIVRRMSKKLHEMHVT